MDVPLSGIGEEDTQGLAVISTVECLYVWGVDGGGAVGVFEAQEMFQSPVYSKNKNQASF